MAEPPVAGNAHTALTLDCDDGTAVYGEWVRHVWRRSCGRAAFAHNSKPNPQSIPATKTEEDADIISGDSWNYGDHIGLPNSVVRKPEARSGYVGSDWVFEFGHWGVEIVNRVTISRVNRAIDRVFVPEFGADGRRAEFIVESDAVVESLGGFVDCLPVLNSWGDLVGVAEMRSEKGEDIEHGRL